MPGAFASALMFGGAFYFSNLFYALLGLTCPVGWIATKAYQVILEQRGGKGIALLLAAFGLMGFGAVMQWWQQRHPLAPSETDPGDTTILPAVSDES